MGNHFQKCELCGDYRLKTSQHTICEACDRELIEDQKPYFEQLEAKSAHRKCRECGGPTGPGRYFNCEDCVTLETEDVWFDSFDDHGCVIEK